MIENNRKSPQLRVAVTPFCNLHCFYCRPEGEGWAMNPRDILQREDIGFLLGVAVGVGFTHVKFTGGEPLLRRDLIDIISDTARCPGVREVQLVTNGILLAKHARALRDVGLSILTLSLDGATHETFRQQRGGDLMPVLAGLRACRDVGLPVRINTVLTKRNQQELGALIEIARQHGTSIKFLDLKNLTAPEGNEEWFRDFVPFAVVREAVEQLGGKFVGFESAPGGIGAPLFEYRMADGVQVVLDDSMAGGYHNVGCRVCPKYPCQDALISLRVTHDGYLKKCLIREDNIVPVGVSVRARDKEGTRRCLGELFNDITSSELVPNVWRPPCGASA